MTSLMATPISGSTLHPDVKHDTPNRRFDFGNRAAAFWLDRQGEMPLWL
jgi:hypothetical protein